MSGTIRARMATNITRTKPKILSGDSKEYFDMWMELGTLPRVSEHYFNLGVVNPKTGKRVNQMLFWYAAMKWVIFNPDDARPHFEKSNMRKFSDEEWESWLVEKAMKPGLLGTSRQRFFAWVRQFGFQKYEYIFKSRFGSFPVDE